MQRRLMASEDGAAMADDGLEWVVNPDTRVLWEQTLEAYLAEKWSPAEEFYDIWMQGYGPENFKAIFVLDKETKEIMATVQIALTESVQGSPGLVAIGDYWVHPSRRGTGLGLKLWDFAFSFPHFQGHNWGLMAVERMSPRYASGRGFDKWFGPKIITMLVDTHNLVWNALNDTSGNGKKFHIREYGAADRRSVIEFDAKVTGGLRRDRFLHAWMTARNALVSLVAVGATGAVCGFLTLNAGPGPRLAVCPWFADSNEVAESLLAQALKRVKSKLVDFNTLKFLPFESNTEAFEVIERVGGGSAREQRRSQGQFTQYVLPVLFDHVFSATELALNVV